MKTAIAFCPENGWCDFKIKNYWKLDFHLKQQVISSGKPTPELQGLYQKTGIPGKNITYSFQKDWTWTDWLCGCATKMHLLLPLPFNFNLWLDPNWKLWSENPAKKPWQTCKKKKKKSLKAFGTSRIDLALNEQWWLYISVPNAKIKENREILKDLINVTCFLAKQELVFRGNNESASSFTCGNYVKLLHTFAEKDKQLGPSLLQSLFGRQWPKKKNNKWLHSVVQLF